MAAVSSESSGASPSRSRKRVSGVVVPHSPTLLQRAGAAIIFVFAHLLQMTFRVRWNDRSGHFVEPAAPPAIYCIWHNRLALCMKIYFGFVKRRSRGKGLAALISASKDGAFLAAVLEQFSVQPVRGSSSRRGAQAILELTTRAQEGFDIAITPDGPRGPRYRVQEGVVGLAQVTGLPIIPVSYHASRKLRLKSWDQFQIPLPFARCEIVFGKTIRVPRDISDAQRESFRQEIERELTAITRDD